MKASPQDVFGHFDSQKYKRPSLNVHEFPFLEFSPKSMSALVGASVHFLISHKHGGVLQSWISFAITALIVTAMD